MLESVGDGEVDTAGELFLARPEGWRDELEAMAARREAEAGAHEEQRREHVLKRELERAELRLAELDELTRQSATDITVLNEDLTEVRRVRRALTEDLDAAVARTELLERTAAEMMQRAEEAEAALAVRERELAEAREQLVELEAELEHRPPRPEDAPATVDAEVIAQSLARLRRVAEVLDGALDSAEMLLPEPPGATVPLSSRKAETGEADRRRPTPLPGGVLDDSLEAARHLLAVSGMTLLVDGYNVTMLAWPDAELADQRDRLVTRLEVLASRTGVEPIVVFDGAAGHEMAPGRPRQQARVRFSPADVEADDEILGLVEARPVDDPVTVVSNDRRVLEGARERGANVITSTVLLEVL